MNGYTGSESNNHNSIDYTNTRDEISTNRYLMGKNGLPYAVGIEIMLHISALNQYANMEYNNEHHKLLINGNISSSNNSSVSAFNSPSFTSTSDKWCSLFSLIHEKINYFD